MIPLGLLLFPVAVVVMVTISALRRRDARKTTERWRQALAQLQVTEEHPAVPRLETKVPPVLPTRHRTDTKPAPTPPPVQQRSNALDAYIAAAFRDAEEELSTETQPEPSEDALTNVTMTSLKKQMEVMSRSRLARGSQPPPGRETLEEEAIAPTQSLRMVARERTGHRCTKQGLPASTKSS